MSKHMSGEHRAIACRMALVGLVALVVAACNGTPTPSATATATATVVAVISAVTATATSTATQPPKPTATETQVPQPLSTAARVGTSVVGTEALGGPTFICSLIHADEAAAVLGQPVQSIKNGIDQDTVAGETINFCTYRGQALAIVMSEVDAKSPEALANVVAQEQAAAQAEDATSTSTLEPRAGLGDQAYWNVAEHAAGYTVIVGSHVFAVALGGQIGDPLAHKAALLKLALLVASRL